MTTAMLVAGLLVFAGIANAYCNVDAKLGGGPHGVVHEVHAAGGAVPVDDFDDACTGVDVPDQETSKPCVQWEGQTLASVNVWNSSRAFIQSTRPIAVRRSLIWEPVFSRVPRLLI